MRLKVADIVFREDLYPRIKHDPLTVQKYAEDLTVLPPIEVNQRNELIDGWHRWTAHKKAEAEDIVVKVTKTSSDSELLELAIERNATHGLQLSQQDKSNMARKIYNATPERERKGKKEHLAKILSVSLSVVHEWLSRIDKDAKVARDARIFEMWMACHSMEEIADEVGVTKETVSAVCQKIPDLEKSDKSAAEHDDLDAPIYNVWKQQTQSEGSKHFGNTEAAFLDRLLYLYTKPFDVVIDPFAGGGSTIDICRKRFRRYFVSDRKPIVEREKEIRQHDIASGLLKPPQWKDVRLVYLDPPYWKQAEGRYSKDAEDLANMDLDAFHESMVKLVKAYAAKLEAAYIALVIQPTQWNAPERQFTDHVAHLLRKIDLPIVQRIQAPYESQQCNAQMVEWAKKNRQLLVLSREFVIWRTE